jgi:hypothetical protein
MRHDVARLGEIAAAGLRIRLEPCPYGFALGMILTRQFEIHGVAPFCSAMLDRRLAVGRFQSQQNN